MLNAHYRCWCNCKKAKNSTKKLFFTNNYCVKPAQGRSGSKPQETDTTKPGIEPVTIVRKKNY